MTTHPLAGQPLELADTLRSGNAWKIRLACGYMGLALTRRTFDIVQGDLETEAFGRINPWRQVPALRTPEGVWLAESQAILWYLGRGTPWLPEGRLAQAQVASWLSFEQTQHMHAFAQPRLLIHLRGTARVDDPAMVEWRRAGMRAAAWMEDHLAGRAFLVGEAPTIADIALYPYTSMAGQGGYDLSAFPHINAWLARMRALPGFTPLLETA
ncbi:glutathione S-transferase family protein [Achromobacter xylosoxidans]|uniref:glutathione S-transferase family protein n=1 Tax=Alcaligenes xylosoxydans xylosoxydans TaxID=85698 RepID=UPI001232394F|nr:glutathione S-transferase family protein [Achromobacter xylosoxidans]KAA5925967.1 glutathione S-transferase family protein [Achromobacter xylosoxidans]MCZ8384555.1 glutathione S-transferase family protein [Achromobacter xylosoxidans]QKI68778.1 glutathione S-transferase family protein [Achromobacter xylosoxidans]